MLEAHQPLSARQALAYADGRAYREELARLNAEEAAGAEAPDLALVEHGAFARDCRAQALAAEQSSAIRIPKALDAMAGLLAAGSRQRVVIE